MNVPRKTIGNIITWKEAPDATRQAKGENIKYIRRMSGAEVNQTGQGEGAFGNIQIVGTPGQVVKCLLLFRQQAEGIFLHITEFNAELAQASPPLENSSSFPPIPMGGMPLVETSIAGLTPLVGPGNHPTSFHGGYSVSDHNGGIRPVPAIGLPYPSPQHLYQADLPLPFPGYVAQPGTSPNIGPLPTPLLAVYRGSASLVPASYPRPSFQYSYAQMAPSTALLSTQSSTLQPPQQPAHAYQGPTGHLSPLSLPTSSPQHLHLSPQLSTFPPGAGPIMGSDISAGRVHTAAMIASLSSSFGAMNLQHSVPSHIALTPVSSQGLVDIQPSPHYFLGGADPSLGVASGAGPMTYSFPYHPALSTAMSYLPLEFPLSFPSNLISFSLAFGEKYLTVDVAEPITLRGLHHAWWSSASVLSPQKMRYLFEDPMKMSFYCESGEMPVS